MERHDTSRFYEDSDGPSLSSKTEDEESLKFGFGCISFVQQLAVNALFPVGLSTLERQFSLTSTHTGIISSWYDFAVLLVVFPICHFGRTAHKGRWIGLGGLVMAAGSLVCALPHFIIDPYDPSHEHLKNSTDVGQCDALLDPLRQAEASQCPAVPSKLDVFANYNNKYFLLFLLGQSLHGFGSTPLFSIGTAYIDENVSQTASPLYLAIHGVISSFGPVIGLFSGGFLLRFYVDFDRVENVPLDSMDPRWIGAWWVGFVGAGITMLFASLPILGFARELPEAKAHRLKDVNQANAASQEAAKKLENEEHSLGATIKIVWAMLHNQTFIILMIIGIAESVIVNGFSAFMPKILETILSVSPAVGSYMASVVIFAAATGLLFGGWIIRHFKMQVGGMFKFTIICEIASLLFLCNFLISCPPQQFAGINIGYDLQPLKSVNLSSTCNAECACAKEWNPVCDAEKGVMFFSACSAGCKKQIQENGSLSVKWEDCTCLGYGEADYDATQSLNSEYCKTDCGYNLVFFMVLLFFAVVATFAAAIPQQQMMLRVVPFDQRTIAIGVNWTFLRLFGFIPGGILFGWIIDKSCLHWGEKCGIATNCLVYDPRKQAIIILALAIVCKLVSTLACIFGYITYTPTDSDQAASMATVDSHGPLSLMVNDDRLPEEHHRETRY
ncbi:hypothetical protein PRIPAC_91733 [Pristionchus pacificus]|uniref:Solute carrier organic anion transporter family member n=1 Tax=Pristionchus pacificus TaxID=54126 RepID=A0A2A6BQB7_PRIPA|nr:hypothetical protein PRIPAC_91733 [Pristionchus pacificus]|eukprot:PDM68077.1 membrane transporter [Pristionchus pacificus]